MIIMIELIYGLYLRTFEQPMDRRSCLPGEWIDRSQRKTSQQWQRTPAENMTSTNKTENSRREHNFTTNKTESVSMKISHIPDRLIIAGTLIFLPIIAGAALFLVFIAGSSAAGTITVDDDLGMADFTTIQDAVDASEEGGTIRVSSGTYNESVVLFRTVKLVGSGYHDTVINGMGSDFVVGITAAGCEITGFQLATLEGLKRCCNGIGNN